MDEYYASGSGVYEGPMWQRGGAIRGFAGRDVQFGNGLGAFGRTLFRWARPVLKYLGKETLKAGSNIANDVLAGTSIKESARSRLKEAGTQIADDTAVAVKKKLMGRGRKKRTMAAKRRRRINKRPIRRKVAVRKRVRRKQALRDIFT